MSTKPKSATVGTVSFPPWGFMKPLYAEAVDGKPPKKFRLRDGTVPTPAQWTAWLDDLADDLSAFLWPRYTKGAWVGAASSWMTELSAADLALMPALALQLDALIGSTSLAHKALFVAEDEAPPSITGFLHYHAAAEMPMLKKMPALIAEGGGAFAGPVALCIKQRMQRPRPYQMAMMLGGTGLKHETANSAITPSLISGHCIQGAMALVNVVHGLEHKADGSVVPVDALTLGHLQAFLIDGGDRRVFAGVHYPSDNISSWYCALRMCRHFFFDLASDLAQTAVDQDRARAVLWDAVANKSAVYGAIKRAVAAGTAPELAGPLQRLQDEAATSAVQVSAASRVAGRAAGQKRTR